MKISKLLSKILLFLYFFLSIVQSSLAEEIKEIWSEIENKENKNTKSQSTTEAKNSSNEIQGIKVKLTDENILVDQTFENSNILLAGLFDPDENDLNLDMWSNSDGEKIKIILQELNSKKLSKFSERIMDIALLTNSYIPNQNFSLDEFQNFTIDHLIKKRDFKLVEEFISKNPDINNKEKLIRLVADYYLSFNQLDNSCSVLESLNLVQDEYLTYFKIYCLIAQNKKEEAQLLYDLKSELENLDEFFIQKFEVLMGYEDDNFIFSDKNILYFHLSHKTDSNFLYFPQTDSKEFIWKYLSNSNLLENLENYDFSDIEQVNFLEKATSEGIFDEKELFNLYKKFQFDIDQLIDAKKTYKLLPDYEGRALLYQKILLTDNLDNKFELLIDLSKSFNKSNFEKSFDNELSTILKKIDKKKISPNFLSFYQNNLSTEENKKKKIKFNNNVFHQSKVLNYFLNKNSLPKTQKITDSLLSKIIKDKNYSFDVKDQLLLRSLMFDGIKVENIDKLTQYESNLNPEIDKIINNKEFGMVLLKMAELIGEQELEELNNDSLKNIIEIMNKAKLISLRNEVLLEILPLKV